MLCSQKPSWHGITPRHRRYVHTLRWQNSSNGFKTNQATLIPRQGAVGAKVSFDFLKLFPLPQRLESQPIFMPQVHSELLPDQLVTRLWQELTRAPHDRHHEWRTPVLATQGSDQTGPQARTVVLRHADASFWALRVYTDARSPKCLELMAQPLAQLIFWSKRLNWQLRVSALATVEFEGEQVDAAWERIRQSHASADYLSALPPGHVRSSIKASAENTADSLQGHHLAILNFKVSSMDWLVLSKDGHRRARLTPAGVLEWLVP